MVRHMGRNPRSGLAVSFFKSRLQLPHMALEGHSSLRHPRLVRKEKPAVTVRRQFRPWGRFGSHHPHKRRINHVRHRDVSDGVFGFGRCDKIGFFRHPAQLPPIVNTAAVKAHTRPRQTAQPALAQPGSRRDRNVITVISTAVLRESQTLLLPPLCQRAAHIGVLWAHVGQPEAERFRANDVIIRRRFKRRSDNAPRYAEASCLTLLPRRETNRPFAPDGFTVWIGFYPNGSA